MQRANVRDLGPDEFGPHSQVALLFKRALERKGVCVHKKGSPAPPNTVSLRTFTQAHGLPHQQIWQLLRGLDVPMPKKTLQYCKAVGITDPDEIELILLLCIQPRLPKDYRHIFDPLLETLCHKFEIK